MTPTYRLIKDYKGITCSSLFIERGDVLVAVLPFSGEVVFPISIKNDESFDEYFENVSDKKCNNCGCYLINSRE